MGAIWRPFNYTGDDPKLRLFFERLNKWARDKDRLETMLATDTTPTVSVSGATTVSAPADAPSTSLALKKGNKPVKSTRVQGLVAGSTGSGSTAAIPGGVTHNIQFNYGGVLDGDAQFTYNTTTNHVGLTGTMNVTGGMTIGGGANIAGLTLTAGAVGTGLTLSSHLVAATVKSTGTLTADGALGVTGRADVIGAMAVGGAAGFTGDVTFGPASIVTSTYRMSGAGSPNFEPNTTGGVHLGRAIRKFGNIFGITFNCTGGGVFYASATGRVDVTGAAGTNHQIIGGSLSVTDINIQGSQFGPLLGFGQDVVGKVTAGNHSPFFFGSPQIPWQGLYVGTIVSSKGSDIASGDTLHIQNYLGGNYYDVTGTNTILGISTTSWYTSSGISITYNSPPGLTSGFMATLQFDNNSGVSHSSKILVPGGANYTFAPGDHATIVSDGSDNFRIANIQPYYPSPIFTTSNRNNFNSTSYAQVLPIPLRGVTAIGASHPRAGLIYRLNLNGRFSSPNPSSTLQVAVKVGGVTIGESQAFTVPASVTDAHFDMTHTWLCAAVSGGTATVRPCGHMLLGSSSTPFHTHTEIATGATEYDVTSNSDQAIHVLGTWGAAGHTLNIAFASLEYLY